MTDTFDVSQPVILLAVGGDPAAALHLPPTLPRGSVVVAADSGLDRLTGLLRVDHVVGDLDSVSDPALRHAYIFALMRLAPVETLASFATAADAPPQALSLFVTDARGHAGLWQLQRQPDEPAATPWGDVVQQRWLREPPQPEGLRIEVWLPATPDSPAGPWPLRLRMAVPRSGHVVELWRTAAP